MNLKFLLFVILPISLFAGIIESFDLEVERTTIPENGVMIMRATLLTSASAKAEIPEIPASKMYTILEKSTQQSSSQSITIINGKQSISRQIMTYYFYRIQFPKAGKVTIPALSVEINGESASTKPIVVTVGGEAAATSKDESLISMSFVCAKKAVYKGEQLPIKLRFSWKANLPAQLTNEGFQSVLDGILPAVEKKFSITVTSKEARQFQENVNGVLRNVVEVDISLSAIDTGTVTVKPIPFKYQTRKQVAQYDDFFDRMMGTTQTSEAYGSTPRLVLTVKSPPNPPAGYTGIVGQVNLRGSVSATTVKAGEGVTLKYVLTGRMKGSELGDITFPKIANFDQFTPEKKVVADSSSGKISTKKEFSSMIIPQKKGTYTIPEISIIWFDPNSGKYNTEKAGPFTISVLKGDGKVVSSKRYLTKEQIATVGTDIRYIKTKLSKGESLKPYKNPFFMLMIPLPWIVMLLIIFYKLSIKLMPVGDDRTIRRGALGKAFRALDKIESGKSKGSPAGVVEQYLLKKFGISAPSMRRDELKESLLKKGASGQAIDSLINFLNAVEMSRYSGASSGTSLAKEAKDTLRLITREVTK